MLRKKFKALMEKWIDLAIEHSKQKWDTQNKNGTLKTKMEPANRNKLE
jgi:hypothetical protein